MYKNKNLQFTAYSLYDITSYVIDKKIVFVCQNFHFYIKKFLYIILYVYLHIIKIKW